MKHKHHKVNFKRFSIKQNISVIVCQIFGHELNETIENLWCERCRLSYEDIYHPQTYFKTMKEKYYSDSSKI